MLIPTARQLSQPANLMSLLRVPLAGLVWVAPGNVWWLLGLMVVAGVSDVLDGRLARSQHTVDDLGAWLDPACDKAFIASVFVAVWVTHGPPWWLALIASARELVLLPSIALRFVVPSWRNREFRWKAGLLGKATTCLQFLLFVVVMFEVRELWLVVGILCGVTGLLATIQYGARAITLMRSSAST